MNDITCQTCGKPLPEDAPQGICPACLLQRTIQDSTAAPQPPELEMQQLAAAFPQLVIEEMIGQGGMGRVYRAQQPHLNRTVALKVLSAERVGDPEWLERFSREARALARLSHPHIVQVYDFGEKPLPYLLMEHVDGVNLRQAMQAGELTTREALTIVPKLCDALHYAHEHGVLHRDIKPENILIDTEGRVKLVDFGLAKLRDEGVLPFTLTQSGAKLGTIAYMAPEQVEKPAEVDHRADIYSLGVVLYEMLTGELPLGRFPTPSEASGVDPRLDSVVMRTLEKKKEKRFQDAGEMRTSLENAQTGLMPDEDRMSRGMFVTLVSLALWPVAAVVLSFQLGVVAMAVVAISSSVLLGCGILRLRQMLRKQPVRSYHGAHIGAMASSAVAFMSGAFWGPALMASIITLLWMKAAWQEHTAAGRTPRLLRGLLSLLGAIFNFSVSITLLAIMHEWLQATLRTQLVSASIAAVDSAGVLLALAAALPGLRRAWHELRGVMPPARKISPVEMSVSALAAIFLAQHSSSWMPQVRLQGKPVWQMLAAEKPRTEAETKRQEREGLMAERRRKHEADKPLRARSEAWVAKATKARSKEEQRAVLQEIQGALKSTEASVIRPGLMAVQSLYQLDFDRAQFRDLARQHLKSDNPEVREAALYALMTCQPEDSDQQRVLALVPQCTDDELNVLAFAMKTVSKHDFTGEFAAPMLGILERGMRVAQQEPGTGTAFDARGVLGAIWGSKVSPQIEARLIEWSRLGESKEGILPTGGLGYEVFYHALSVQSNKSLAAVERILELAYHPDTTNIAGRCLWGLNGTVPDKADQSYVAGEVIRLLEMRSADYLWQRGLTLISQYSNKEHLPVLETLAARETLPQARKDELGRIIARLRATPAP